MDGVKYSKNNFEKKKKENRSKTEIWLRLNYEMERF